jgi:D-glycero-alpha-D-manno-heptose 1-phosphate guanylyltransferase
MASIAGRPFLEILLGSLACNGCTRVLLSVGHLHQVIQNHFGPSFQSMRLDYVIEREPLGTGGAIRAALEQATEPSVLVLNGDTFLQADLAALLAAHESTEAALTIAIAQQPDIARYGGVLVEGGRIVGFQEKGRSGPGWINAGVYAIVRELAWPPALSGKFSFESDFLMPELARLAPLAFPVNGFFLDIGVPEDLDRAQTALEQFRFSR